MTAAVLTRQLAAVAAPAADVVPVRIQRRALAGGWPTCDVCVWPVHPAALVPGRRPRHPGCLCCVCDAPLTVVEPGVLWHPQCAPTTARTSGSRGRRLALALVKGGKR